MSIPSVEEWERQVREYEATHPPPMREYPICGFTSQRWRRQCQTCQLESESRIARCMAIAAELYPGRDAHTLEEMMHVFIVADARDHQSESKPS